jgi:hypothetical protein
MNPIIKPWSFKGWAIDLIGLIYPPSSKGHKFVLVATHYFTKWVEAIPIKTVTSSNMIVTSQSRTHCLSVWYTSNYHNLSRESVHFRGI